MPKAYFMQQFFNSGLFRIRDPVYYSNMSKRKPDPKSPVRNKLRLQVHHYGANRRGFGKGYSVKEIEYFLEINQKGENGRYLNTDVQIAQLLTTSLATVQYLRRKFNMIRRLAIEPAKYVEYMMMSEKALFALVHAK